MSKYAVCALDAEGNVLYVSFHVSLKDAEGKEKVLAENNIPFRRVEPAEGESIYAQSLHDKRWCKEAKEFVPKQMTLDHLRGPIIQKIREQANREMASDIEIDAGTVQAHGGAYQTISTFAAQIRSGVTSPHGGIWRMKDNSMVEMGDADLLALDDAIRERNTAIRLKMWNLIDNVSRETCWDILESYSVAEEWNK